MQMIACKSSQIKAHGHDPATNTLAIEYHSGHTYHYVEVFVKSQYELSIMFQNWKSVKGTPTHYFNDNGNLRLVPIPAVDVSVQLGLTLKPARSETVVPANTVSLAIPQDVSPDQYDALSKAESIGSHFHANIKGNHDFVKVTK